MSYDLDIEKISSEITKEILQNQKFEKEINDIIREKLKGLLKE